MFTIYSLIVTVLILWVISIEGNNHQCEIFNWKYHGGKQFINYCVKELSEMNVYNCEHYGEVKLGRVSTSAHYPAQNVYCVNQGTDDYGATLQTSGFKCISKDESNANLFAKYC